VHPRLPSAIRNPNETLCPIIPTIELDFFDECPRTLDKYFIGKRYFVECFLGQRKALDKLKIIKTSKFVLIRGKIPQLAPLSYLSSYHFSSPFLKLDSRIL
jgi:hypothetical protein